MGRNPSNGEQARELSWDRHPADLARLLASFVGLLLALALMVASPEDATRFSSRIRAVFSLIPLPIRTGSLGLAQVVAIAAPVVLLGVLIWLRHVRLLAVVTLAGGLAAGISLLLNGLYARTTLPEATTSTADSWVTGARFPSAPYVAGAAAITTVLVPALPRRWRRAAWLGLLALAGLRVVTAVAVPLHVATAVLFGITLGSALLLAFGAPRRRVELGALARDLADAGIAARDIAPIGDTGIIGATVDDMPVRLHIFDRDDRDADLLYRIFTNAQRRGIENERFAWSPERIADQEALVTLLAARAGVPVLDVVGLARTVEGAGIVVVAHGDVQALDTLDPEEITDELLQDAWRSVTALHDQRIAHGRLHAGHLFRNNSDRRHPHVAIGDLSRAQLGASRSRISIDVAELLTSTALLVGPDRAIAAANAVPVERLADALPLLQPLALSPTTRRGIGHGSTEGVDILEALRSAVQVAASVDEYQMAELQRISFGRVASVLGTGVLVFVFLAFASNWSSIADAMREADWVYLPAILAMAALTYPAGALSLMGGVTSRLPFSQTSGVMLAQSFLNRFTPANIGGMALRTRYLQKNGVDLPVAASSVGLTSMASGLVQVVFIIGFLLWSGSDNDAGFSLPDASTIAIGMLALLVVGAVIWVTPLRHRLLDSKLTVSALQIWRNVVDLARSPGKVALLFGGAALGKMAIILAFAWSARALGIALPFAEIGALYLTANTVASVAPTPGGVGAMEAALIAVLTGAGVDGAAALSAVLVFRVATFWLPVPFAWGTLRHLRKRQVV